MENTENDFNNFENDFEIILQDGTILKRGDIVEPKNFYVKLTIMSYNKNNKMCLCKNKENDTKIYHIDQLKKYKYRRPF